MIGVAGPYQEDTELKLSCVVSGGKTQNKIPFSFLSKPSNLQTGYMSPIDFVYFISQIIFKHGVHIMNLFVDKAAVIMRKCIFIFFDKALVLILRTSEFGLLENTRYH